MDVEVSVVVATKNRGHKLLETTRSILGNPPGRWELIVVDQSDTSAARDALKEAGFLEDPRLRYEHISTTGVSRGRNHGLTVSRGSVVLFTDDDCIVPADWIERTWLNFQRDPTLDLFFGGVVVPPTEVGWAFQFQPMTEGKLRPGYRYLCEKFGLGSNMAVRRSAAALIGQFDEMLGAGAPFAPAEDTDYGYRALKRGFKLFAATEPAVTHLGVQPRGVASARLQIGMAAMSAKHIRCGDLAMVFPPLGRILSFVLEGTTCLLKGRRPSGYRSAAYVLIGLLRGLRQPVDVRARVYRASLGGTS